MLTRLNRVLLVPCLVVQVQNGGVGKVQPQRCIGQLPSKCAVYLPILRSACIMRILKDAVLRCRDVPLDFGLVARVGAADRRGPAAGSRIAACGVLVADDTDALRIWLIHREICLTELTASSRIFSTHPVFSVFCSSLVRMDDDAVALTNSYGQRSRVERFDGHQVGGDYLENVVVDGEVEMEICGAVDDANEVLLVMFKVLLEVGAAAGRVVTTSSIDDDGVSLGQSSE